MNHNPSSHTSSHHIQQQQQQSSHNFISLFDETIKNFENDHQKQEENLFLTNKYKFLYQQPLWWQTINHQQTIINLYMIHKIEIYPHYTYPTIFNASEQHPNHQHNHQRNEDDDNDNLTNIMMIRQNHHHRELPEKIRLDSENSSINSISSHLFTAPYRTVSHYGFNYPSTYMPNITLHPACSITPVDLQRQKVIAFIKRLNLDAQAVEQQQQQHIENSNKALKVNMENEITGKEDEEENIYENTKHLPSSSIDLDNTGSFISVKEIQLNTSKGRRTSVSSHCKSTDNQRQPQGDLQSDQFSSLLSISGSYPHATHSHTGDVDHDNDHDHFATDSGDNSSNFDINSRKTTHDSLYRSYLQRNFIPLTAESQHSIIDLQEDDEHDPHKPESEQQSQNVKHSCKLIRSDENKHVTLTLNSLKRSRASSLGDKNDKQSTSRSTRAKSNKTNEKAHILSTQTSFRAQLSDANSSCDSSMASTAIEIHINVNIRNSDCVKNLQNHEQEFKSKLEKVIDDEINLITQELVTPSPQCQRGCDDDRSVPLNPTQRCLSAPESMSLFGRDPFCTEADRHLLYNFSDSAATTPLPSPSSTSVPCQEKSLMSSLLPQQSNLYTLRYRHTLAMLEHELEMLLNGIIRNMCDCKMKISQISEDIRTATLHVGSLNPTGGAKGKERHIFNRE